MEMYSFKSPCTIIISGPSGSGKSSLLKQILLNRDQHFSKPFHKVKYYYAEARPEGIPSVEYHRGMPSEITNNPNSGHALYIFDDLMSEANNDDLRNAFIRTSHHQNITIVLIIQNLFFKSPVARDISLNTKYMIIFKNPRDCQQISFLARQLNPSNSKAVVNMFNSITREPHSYLMIDLTQDTPSPLRFRTDILNPNYVVVYALLDDLKQTSLNGEEAYQIE